LQSAVGGVAGRGSPSSQRLGKTPARVWRHSDVVRHQTSANRWTVFRSDGATQTGSFRCQLRLRLGTSES